ncbi:MAG TPA: hypothetical protein DEP87_02400 [Candidatus Pacebacteria bacterium]|nr:hypothetical protein [Candidatus Paceibacterota bacterium]
MKSRVKVGQFFKSLLIAIGCGLIIIICTNEVAARGFLPFNPFGWPPLNAITWQNLLAGPAKWQILGWWQEPNLSVTKFQLPSNFSQPVQQAGQALETLWQRSGNIAQVVDDFVATQIISSSIEPTGAAGSALASSDTAGATSQSGPSPTSTQVSPTNEPLAQRTLEYTKYLYCKETVKAYELRFPALTQ